MCIRDRSNRCQKRTAEVLSIHIGIGADSYSLEETVAASDDLMQQLETRLLLHDLAGKFSGQQMEMVRLKTCGYNLRAVSYTHLDNQHRSEYPVARCK